MVVGKYPTPNWKIILLMTACNYFMNILTMTLHIRKLSGSTT
jgi:hypothetical protein